MPKTRNPQRLGVGKAVEMTPEGKLRTTMLRAFEDFLPLEGFASVELKGRAVGMAILKKSDSYRFIFGFRSQGIHDTLRDDQIAPTSEAIEAALKEIPAGESATFHLSSFASDQDRQAELDRLFEVAPSDPLKLIVVSEKARSQQLYKAGVRKPKSLYIYCSYTVELGQKTDGNSDLIEKQLAKVASVWEQFKGNGPTLISQRYEDMLEKAFNEGYLRWEQLLNIKMGLEIQPLSLKQLWTQVYNRFSEADAPPLQQWLQYSEKGLVEHINGDIHPASVLVQGNRGKPTVPIAERKWINVKERFTGILTFTEKPAGFVDQRHQLRYLWDMLCKPHVFDTEIVCQITQGNSTLVRTRMQRVLKQSNLSASMAEDHHSVDVAAGIKAKRSVEAQAQLYEGAAPVKVATVMLVHRRTQAQLDEACTALTECFQLPAKVIRETEVTWLIWLQTLPVYWDRLLSKPYSRQMTYLSGEAAGLIPLTQTKPGSAFGFELIADEGGTPVRVDFLKAHRNIAVFGTTRSGKSVLVSGMLTTCLASGLPIVCMDYPKPDGTSTFTDYAKFLEPRAAYFDIGKESNNLLELPDIRHLEGDEWRERFDDYKSFLESAIVTMVMPQSSDSMLEQTVRSIIGRGLTVFFDDAVIMGRYDAALEGAEF
ncbi:MAG: hypothetical protein AAFN08_16515 [Cyanobacteria bacterium J06559_3]